MVSCGLVWAHVTGSGGVGDRRRRRRCCAGEWPGGVGVETVWRCVAGGGGGEEDGSFSP